MTAPAPQASAWLTTGTAARKLGLSADFVLGEIRDGRMKARVIARPGKRTIYRIHVTAFRAYVAAYWRPALRPQATDDDSNR